MKTLFIKTTDAKNVFLTRNKL